MKDFDITIDLLGFWPGCKARTWIVQYCAISCNIPAPSLFLVTGVALHHQVFLWIGAGACPCTIQVLALHPGQNPKKSMKNSKSFTKRASARREMLIFCALGIVSNGESIWRGPAMVPDLQIRCNHGSVQGHSSDPKTGRCRATPVIRPNPKNPF